MEIREIIGNTTATPNPRPDWSQQDDSKADYIKNKPEAMPNPHSLKFIGEVTGAYDGSEEVTIDTSDIRGTTFIPSVAEDGTLSWTNDRGLDNPEPVNIKGASGVYVGDGDMPEGCNVQIDPSGAAFSYELTEAEKTEIAQMVYDMFPRAEEASL